MSEFRRRLSATRQNTPGGKMFQTDSKIKQLKFIEKNIKFFYLDSLRGELFFVVKGFLPLNISKSGAFW